MLSNVPKRGFTLLETLVVIAIVSIVTLILGFMIQYIYRGNDYVLQEGTAVENAQIGLTNAIQDLREASYGDDGSYPIANIGTSSVTFYADYNNTGDVEMLQYYLLGNTLYRSITTATGTPPSYAGQPAATTTIATYVQNSPSTPIFQYYNASDTAVTSSSSIYSITTITTTLDIDVNPTRAPSAYTLTGSATLRNL